MGGRTAKDLNCTTEEPGPRRRIDCCAQPRLTEKLAGWLKMEAGKSRKQRRTLKQMHAGQGCRADHGSLLGLRARRCYEYI